MVTMKNIAAAVGVSQSTVSYVLSGKYQKLNISEKTRQKIEETADKMGYRVNQLARSMVTGKNNVIIYLSQILREEYRSDMLSGACFEAEENNYFIKLSQYQYSGFR